MSLLYTGSDRMPTLTFPRDQNLEALIQVVFFWNGGRAPNGDGWPAGGAVDYTTPLAGPFPIFTDDHGVWLGGGWANGGWAEPGALRSPSGGWGGGGFAGGPFGVGSSEFKWRFGFPLRDGDYVVVARYADCVGGDLRRLRDLAYANVQASGGSQLDLTVAALPRPPSNLSWTIVGSDVVASWLHSPEFMPTS